MGLKEDKQRILQSARENTARVHGISVETQKNMSSQEWHDFRMKLRARDGNKL